MYGAAEQNRRNSKDDGGQWPDSAQPPGKEGADDIGAAAAGSSSPTDDGLGVGDVLSEWATFAERAYQRNTHG